MIDCNTLLKKYSLHKGARRYRILDDETVPYEVVFEENREFEELMLSIFLWDKYLPSERQLSFGTRQYSAFKEVKQDIEQLITFLTHRKISIRFIPTRKQFHRQRRISSGENPKTQRGAPCLFSGGLDSAAGALSLAKNHLHPTLSHTATGNIVLGKVHKLRVHPILRTLPLIITDLRTPAADSNLLMTRGLIFLSNALVLASSMKRKQIYMPENGPLMINPRVSPLSEPTKNAHPYLISTLEKIYNHITQSKVKIIPLFKDETKAEIIAKVLNDKIIDRTWSCFKIQGQTKMCGLCFACFVRRLSTLAVGYREQAGTYQYDPFLVERKELGRLMKIDLDILHDTFLFLEKLLRDDRLIRKEMYLIPEDFFSDSIRLMRNFSLDIFLGLSRYVKNSQPHRLGTLGRFALKLLRDIPQSDLEARDEELRSIRKCAQK